MISNDLEAALVRALLTVWRETNATYFKGSMHPPVLELGQTSTRYGQWDGGTRTITLQRAFVLESEWGVVVEVLRHEMAHQFVDEVLGQPDETPHGPAFRAVCEKMGIDPRASGLPLPSSGSLDEDARILTRISKLLALAESSNAHEAELATAEAQRLMLKYNLATTPSGYSFRHLGRPTGRVTETERIVGGLLGEFFFVEAIWVPVWRPLEGKRGSVLEICGAPVNLEMATYVHGFLFGTADRLWTTYRSTRGLEGNRDRRTFQAGVMAGFREKLEAERRHHQEVGLVWVGDGDLRHYFRRRHPYVRTVHGSGHARNEVHTDGRAAGRNLVLHRPIETRGPGRGQLPPRRS
jgi:hypothetical protein